MNVDKLFHQILKPALGCTEPVAVALAASAAAQASAGWTPETQEFSLRAVKDKEVRRVTVRVSRNIFKNAFAILIPNAEGHKGIVMAAALGLFCDPRQEMGLFQNLDAARIRAAEALVETGCVQVSISDEPPASVAIEVEVELAGGSGASMIRGEHSNIACLKRNGSVVYGCEQRGESESDLSLEMEELKAMDMASIVELLDRLPESVFALLRTTLQKNIEACKVGLSRPMGVGTGYFGELGGEQGSLSRYISSFTAAGSDARMSGYPAEIMTSAGSGNQGIIATIPVAAYASMHFIDETRMLKALALSHLVTMYITTYVGYLSALCGVAIKAGIGAACGVTYAMGGGANEVGLAVKIMAATLTGMLCDGAKSGCALKVSSAADTAVRAATLAMREAQVPDDNGIVAPTAEGTVRNLAELGHSMEIVDQKIIDIMLAKIIQPAQAH
jgi:L-cysteine desulfidase